MEARATEGRVIEVRRTCEADPENPISNYLVDFSDEPIGPLVRAIADALQPEAERMPSWCVQVIYRPDGLPVEQA